MEDISVIKKIPAPFGKEVEFFQVTYDNGFRFLRLQIREGKRFTTLDLDINTVKEWSDMINQWLEQQNPE